MPELETPLTEEEADHLLLLKQQVIQSANNKLDLRTIRRRLRYRIFRLREGNETFDMGLRKLIESQFEPNMNWENFTFEWDIGANDPLKVVSIFEWIDSGGSFESLNVPCSDGVTRPQKQCKPTAFTKQGI